MASEDYPKLLKGEKNKLSISTVVLPFLSIIILSYAIEVYDTTDFLTLSILVAMFTAIFSYLVTNPEYLSLSNIRKQKKPIQKYSEESAIPQFQLIGFEKMVIRHILQEKTFRAYVVVTTVSMIILLVLFFTSESNDLLYLFGIWSIPGSIVYVMIVSRSNMSRRKDFGFCFTQGCFKIISNFRELDDVDKTNYLILGLSSYDVYLKRNLKVRIKNLEKIYSQIISSEPKIFDESLEKIHDLLEEGSKLDLLRYLSKLLGDTASKEILEPEKITKKFKDSLPVVITVITTIIMAMEFLRQIYD